MTTGEILTLLRARGFRFAHALGQNFLADDEVLSRIADSAQADGACVLEIGAGAGCLTVPLASRAKKVLAVEIDERLIPVLETALQGRRNVRIVQGDALKVDLAVLAQETFGDEDFLVAANMPYSITTPVLFRLLESRLPIQRMCVMLQKEAVDRVVAQPGEKAYGPLAIYCAYRAEVERLFRVPPHCFVPQPHVNSEVIELRMRPRPDPAQEQAFLRLVKNAFRMRRKTLLNNLLQCGMGKEQAQKTLEAAGLAPSVRAEALSLADFVRLYGILCEPDVANGKFVV